MQILPAREEYIVTPIVTYIRNYALVDSFYCWSWTRPGGRGRFSAISAIKLGPFIINIIILIVVFCIEVFILEPYG